MARPRDGAELGVPMRGKEASARPARGRVCAAPGCDTVLSTYNATSLCWLHAPIAYKPVRRPIA